MPIRNPFAKRSDVTTGLQPQDDIPRSAENGTRPTFEKVDTMGSKSSSAMSISSKRSQEPVEYKMSGMRRPLTDHKFSGRIELIIYLNSGE